MARQEITLESGDCTVLTQSGGTTIRWRRGDFAGRPQIISALAPVNTSRFFSSIEARGGTSRVILSVTDTSTGTDQSRDLTDLFETQGVIRIVTAQASLTVELAGMDTSEPYSFDPTNAADVVAFANAHTVGQQYAGVLTLADESLIPTMAHLDAEASAWAYKAVEPSGAAYKGVVLQ